MKIFFINFFQIFALKAKLCYLKILFYLKNQIIVKNVMLNSI